MANWRDRFVRTTREDLVPPTGHGPRARSDPPAASPSGSSSSSSPASIYADAAAAAAPTRVVPVVGKTERATPQVAVPVATGVACLSDSSWPGCQTAGAGPGRASLIIVCMLTFNDTFAVCA